MTAQTPIRNPQSASDDIVAALSDQVACYQRLAKLAAIQHQHIQQSQTDALLTVLQDRQTVLEEIGRLETLVAAAKQGWAAFVQTLKADVRERAEALMAETRKLLEEITASDRDDVLVLQQRKLNLGKQINQASAAKQLNRNYAAAAYGPGRSTMDLQR